MTESNFIRDASVSLIDTGGDLERAGTQDRIIDQAGSPKKAKE